jgi:hypothetical protein
MAGAVSQAILRRRLVLTISAQCARDANGPEAPPFQAPRPRQAGLRDRMRNAG